MVTPQEEDCRKSAENAAFAQSRISSICVAKLILTSSALVDSVSSLQVKLNTVTEEKHALQRALDNSQAATRKALFDLDKASANALASQRVSNFFYLASNSHEFCAVVLASLEDLNNKILALQNVNISGPPKPSDMPPDITRK